MLQNRIFTSLLFVVMFIVMLSQILILMPVYNNSIYTSGSDDSNEYGEITLRSSIYTDDVLILQNGEPIAAFLHNTVTFPVRNNCVIEIDGSRFKKTFDVEIVNKSGNVAELENETITVSNNIAILGRVFLKKY